MDCLFILGGVCIERRLELGNATLSILGLIGLLSLYFTYRQLRLGQRAQQTQISIQLHNDFMKDEARRQFAYELDYSAGPRAWKFDPAKFPHSEEEKHLDILLYKLSFIGSLVRNGDISVSDLDWLRSELGIVMQNSQVHAYLKWLKQPEQIPDHSSFAGAIYLYEAMYGRKTSTYRNLEEYLKKA